jgi:Zn-dependent protease with chaperone function
VASGVCAGGQLRAKSDTCDGTAGGWFPLELYDPAHIPGEGTALDGIEDLRAALPVAVRFGDLVAWVVATFAVAAACAWVGMAVALLPLRRWRRRAAAAPAPGPGYLGAAGEEVSGGAAATPVWVAEARLVYPARQAAWTGVLVTGILMTMAVTVAPGGLLSSVPRVVVRLAMVAACVAGVIAAGRWLTGTVRGCRPRWRTAWRDALVYWLLARPWLVLLVAVVILSGATSGAEQWVIVAAGDLALGALAWASGLPLLRLLRLARPAGERVRGAVERAAGRMQTAVPPSFEVSWSMANAFALPTVGQLVFSTRLLAVLDDAQLAAVAAHELEHLREPLRVRLSRLAGVPILMGLAAIVPIARSLGFPGTVLLIGSLFLAAVIAGRTMQRMEVQADAAARGAEGDAGVYAAVLTRLYEANLMPAVMSRRRRTHPALYDRLVAAGAPPPYPRPAPPGRAWLAIAFAVQVVTGVAVCGLLAAGVPRAATAALGSERSLMAIVCLTGGDAYSLGWLEHRWFARHQVRPAIAWARMLAAAHPTDVGRRCYLAKVLAWGGRCAEAGAELERAEPLAAGATDRGYLREARDYMRGLNDPCPPVARGVASTGPPGR